MWTTVLLCQVLLAWSAVAKDVLFIIDLTWEVGAPDGFSREMILVNGTSPGPALILDEGDNVKVRTIAWKNTTTILDLTIKQFLARNHMHHNVTIHFHGITQLHTPWSDGVPGVSQTPILPHEEFLYQWTADEYGTVSTICNKLGAKYLTPHSTGTMATTSPTLVMASMDPFISIPSPALQPLTA
jgi:FtsP/CotA-like multicopper oxidase with cupredoxin domain